MSNPFENPDGRYLVLVNDEGQYSLWPAFAEVPAGWAVAQQEAGHAESLAFINENWTDMRPRSVVEAMG
ncbi:MbtH family protein [Streptomyces tricolor]|uniref:MbtH family protein n=1 Tax=Streptomyces tricolor TaxID=68277 RepID=UPI0037F80F6A